MGARVRGKGFVVILNQSVSPGELLNHQVAESRLAPRHAVTCLSKNSKTRNQISHIPTVKKKCIERTTRTSTLVKDIVDIPHSIAACAKAENKDLIGIYGHFADFLRLCPTSCQTTPAAQGLTFNPLQANECEGR